MIVQVEMQSDAGAYPSDAELDQLAKPDRDGVANALRPGGRLLLALLGGLRMARHTDRSTIEIAWNSRV